MSNLRSRAQAFLNRTLSVSDGVSVAYSREGLSVTLTAWIGRTVFRQDMANGTGGQVVFGDRDYLFPVASLVLDGVAVEPRQGDRITQTVGGLARTFEVLTPETGDPAARYSDPQKTVWRVHTKEVTPP